MRIRKIENVSEHAVTLKRGDGSKLVLHPGAVRENIVIINEAEVKGHVKITYNLNEGNNG